jgi:hypothetical protein
VLDFAIALFLFFQPIAIFSQCGMILLSKRTRGMKMNKTRVKIIEGLKRSLGAINREFEKGRFFMPDFAIVPKFYSLNAREETEAQRMTSEGYLAHVHDNTYVITKKGYELLKQE